MARNRLQTSPGYGNLHGVQTQVPPNRLAELRNARGLKLYDIAAAIRVDPSTISRWEKGGSISDDHKHALAEYFEVSIVHLMRWDEAEAA